MTFRIETTQPNPITGGVATFTWEVRVAWVDEEQTEITTSTRCVGNSTRGTLAPSPALRQRARRRAVRMFRA